MCCIVFNCISEEMETRNFPKLCPVTNEFAYKCHHFRELVDNEEIPILQVGYREEQLMGIFA